MLEDYDDDNKRFYHILPEIEDEFSSVDEINYVARIKKWKDSLTIQEKSYFVTMYVNDLNLKEYGKLYRSCKELFNTLQLKAYRCVIFLDGEADWNLFNLLFGKDRINSLEVTK